MTTKLENLFDHGKSTQVKIVEPTIIKIKAYFEKNGFDGGFKDFFMSELKFCFARIGEFEERPVWVQDVADYRMRSEIVTFISIFSNLEPDKKPSYEENIIISATYKDVQEMGKEREWDLAMLHLQFMRISGSKLTNYITAIVFPRTLNPVDYN